MKPPRISKRWMYALFLGLMLSVGGWVGLGRTSEEPAVHGALQFATAMRTPMEYALGNFRIRWRPAEGGALEIVEANRPEKILWATLPGVAFAGAAVGKEQVSESRGSFRIQDHWDAVFPDQTLDTAAADASSLQLGGTLQTKDGRQSLRYCFQVRVCDERQLGFSLSVDDSPCNRLFLTARSDADEHFFGFGTQYSYFDLKGRRVPIFVMEQGIGRGLQPLTGAVDLAAKSGGSWHTTYAAVPHFITSRLRSLFLENAEYSVFDLRSPDRIQIQVFSAKMAGRIVCGDSPADLIREYTQTNGFMRPLPDWILRGAVVGMQGGTDKVRSVWAALQAHQTPVAAFWLQDWVGQRSTSLGKQLWWNWELDQDRYPGWDALRADLDTAGIALMGYVNPFLADVSKKSNVRRNLFLEAMEKGYLVRHADGAPSLIKNTDFSAGLLDLSNPEAWRWMKNVMKDQVVATGMRGWMADFGEALPYDALLASGESATAYHNRYPERWAQLNREVIEETGQGNDYVFFMRSGYRESPRYATLFWLGDQLVSWDAQDGIKTAVTGLLSSGLSGFAFNHSDIGGYTSVRLPLLGIARGKELLMRWMELNAFTTVFRTHEGIDPEANAQFYTDEETLSQFSRCARCYAAWEFYRKSLVEEASRTGLPVVRHPFIHYPDDPEIYRLSWQEFMVGDQFLVAPVLEPGATTVPVYFPKGRWVHVWTQTVYGDADRGVHAVVAAPMGRPAVFYKEGSETGRRFVQNVKVLLGERLTPGLG